MDRCLGGKKLLWAARQKGNNVSRADAYLGKHELQPHVLLLCAPTTQYGLSYDTSTRIRETNRRNKKCLTLHMTYLFLKRKQTEGRTT